VIRAKGVTDTGRVRKVNEDRFVSDLALRLYLAASEKVHLGKAASVNSVSIFVAVMFWGWMWGALGLVLAVPVLMIVKTVADHVESLSGLSELLSDKAP